MPRRIESPSSILSYKQCPRKYYYQYIEHRQTKSNIHTLRGNIVHDVLDRFFVQPPTLDNDTYMEKCVTHLRTLFENEWSWQKANFLKMGMHPAALQTFYVETLGMLSLWLEKFLTKLTATTEPINDRFRALTPLREQEFVSPVHAVKGYVDVIEQENDVVRVMDYKTSSKAELTDEYRLQLGIYALLYHEKNGAVPDSVGIYFLKHADHYEKTMVVTDELLQEARFAIETHHLSTVSDRIGDYPQKIGPLCKWSTGQCDFYDLCFTQKKLS
ncbi:PD-(D/E)XK nuclease family protein [Candidatus Woesearchaeota archaeon]|nr:PD-(D/E)XK nuclease family protein [Candidatus Woesearchaeota archaeon]